MSWSPIWISVIKFCFQCEIVKMAQFWFSIVLENVQISYDGFLSNFRPLPLHDGILTFSANPLPALWRFQPTPSPRIYRKKEQNKLVN